MSKLQTPEGSQVTHEFIVLDVQEDQLWPKMGALRGLDDLGDVYTRNEQLEVFHDYVEII